ncbi:MAG TPA: flagellar biosynthetic protein FliR [Polyangiaceae bacterium]|nr:flagellar biosynthetic protein FliR [Polyangiaceae bacterium]
MLETLVAALKELTGADPRAYALAWARVLPMVVLVPAFGLSGVATPIRVTLALGMAGAIAPALHVVPALGLPLWLECLREALRTTPLALGTAAILWAAVMAGGLADNLRASRESVELPVLDDSTTPFGALLGLAVALGFLETGGTERIVSALAEPRLHASFAVAAERLAACVGIAVGVAAPLVAASVLIELSAALVARSASPAYVAPVLAPLRSLGVLFVVWIALDRMVELLVVLASRA